MTQPPIVTPLPGQLPPVVLECAELRRQLAEATQYSEAACAAWQEEFHHRERETARVLRLKRVCDDMLSTYRDDAKEVLVTQERMEAWRAEIEKCFDPKIDPRKP